MSGDHGRRLKTTLDNFAKVNDEVGAAFIKVEDGLTALEDREQRRAARRTVAEDPRLQSRGGV